MLKNKKIILIALAVVFVISLFLIKNITEYKKQELQNEGLVYDGEKVESLITKDTDKDGLLDWEESLWETDPTKKDTDGDGIGDEAEVAKIKEQKIENGEVIDPDNLTETDKFSRELFSTLAALNQAGAIDEATVEELSNSLSEQIQNSTPKKIYAVADIKVIKDDSTQAVQNYNDVMETIYAKYPIEKGVTSILQEFIVGEEEVNVDALLQLDPIIKQMSSIINEAVKINTPQSLSSLHLDFINSLERLVENLTDLKLYETDTIVTLGAISQYETNLGKLEIATNNLGKAISEKLGN